MHVHVKTALVTVGTVLLCTYAVSRFAPGLAARAGLVPRPAFPQYQTMLPEPIGMVPLLGAGFKIAPYGWRLWYGLPDNTAANTTPATSPDGL